MKRPATQSKWAGRRVAIQKVMQRYWKWLLLPAMVILVLASLYYTAHIPFWDQWELVEAYRHKATGILSWKDFWVQHNEHRIVLPRLIMFTLGLVTHWDPFYEVIVNLILGSVIVGQMLRLIKRTFPDKPRLMAGVSLFAAYLLLSPGQWENWLWGWQIQWFLSIVGLLGMLLCLTRKTLSKSDLAGAVTMALVATYSLGNGFVAWGVGLLVLLARSEVAQTKKLAWFATGALATGMHYYRYVNPVGHPSKSLFLHQPVDFIKYVFVYLGRPLGYDYRLTMITGCALIVSFLGCCGLLIRKKQISVMVVAWIGLGLYAAAGAVLTGISRLGLGVDQSYASRYTTVSNLFTIACAVLALLALQYALRAELISKDRYMRVIVVGALAVFMLGGYNYVNGIREMRRHHRRLATVEQCLRTARTGQEACLTMAYPNKAIVWERLVFLRKGGLGGHVK